MVIKDIKEIFLYMTINIYPHYNTPIYLKMTVVDYLKNYQGLILVVFYTNKN